MQAFSEDHLVEESAMKLLAQMGWPRVNAMHEQLGPQGTLGRESRREVILTRELRLALKALNPSLPSEALEQAVEELTAERLTLSQVAANHELYALLKSGVEITFTGDDGQSRRERVKVIDWREAGNNRFLAVQQLWVAMPDGMGTRRPDVVCFVNGLPLVLMELKAVHKQLIDGYQNNLRDYRVTIPQLMVPNAMMIVSNGLEARMGSLTAGWEHFGEWKKVEREDEPKSPGLMTMLRGVCDKTRLLDLIENFTLFSAQSVGLIKVLAMNHQYLGVNNAVGALQHAQEKGDGKLGVFWHTQGSGKSFSMVFFAQKVLRTVPGNWSFLVVTDRNELDGQIYRTFAQTGAVKEPEHEVRADSAAGLRQLLTEDHRYLFTLIQKFRTDGSQAYPALTQRRDVIVMTDEAHRSQYDIFAGNMRAALPHASFIGFTGTPLMAGEHKTREVFGDYVSIYNFRDAVEDQATVPLYYENRIPELELTNDELQPEMEALLDDAGLDDAAEAQVARLFSQQYQLITRSQRLDAVARDLVTHFLGRGQFGKAMVVSIDKATAVRMYDRVKRFWKDEIDLAEAELTQASGEARDVVAGRLKFLRETDMAVVVSSAQNEVADFKALGLDIAPHRKRMVEEDLEKAFKNAQHPLRIVFVCAMWMTGFDAPSVSTIYLDKPMRGHTLMQTIARANRVWEAKVSGLIVDYIGVFRNLEQALAIYGAASGSGVQGGDNPVQPKSELLGMLTAEVAGMRVFLQERHIDMAAVMAAVAEGSFAALQVLLDTKDALLENEGVTRSFLDRARIVERLFKAVLPDPGALTFVSERALLVVLSEMLRAATGQATAPEGVMQQVEALLDESVSAHRYLIRDGSTPLDLSKLDFDKLAANFASSPHKFTELEKLKRLLSGKVSQLTRLNKTRTNFAERLEALIRDYNQGALNIETLFGDLMALRDDLDAEGQRAVREGLSEEELAVFDLVMWGADDLSRRDEQAIKASARHLVETLRTQGMLTLDWRKRQRDRARVRVAIKKELRELGAHNGGLEALLGSLYGHVYEAYADDTHNIYA